MAKRLYLYMFVVCMGFILTGCNKAPAIIQTTTEKTKVTDLLSDNGSKPATDITLMELTDPALYSFLNSSSDYQKPSSARNLLPGEEKKVGKLISLNKNRKFNIAGSAQIDLADTGYVLKVNGFSYNGECGSVYFGLGLMQSPTKPIFVYPNITGSVQDQSYDYVIPNNINLIQFDSLNIYCSNQEDPVSSSTFN